MLAILQRIRSASVVADGEPYSQCGRGFLILLGVSAEDTEQDAELLAEKIAKLRVFQDEAGKMTPLVPAVCRGKFRSDMQVSLVNDGPVTIPMDSRVLKGERSI